MCEFEEYTIQVTLRVTENMDKKLRTLGAELVSNRQGAINHILDLYFSKELSQSSAEELR